MNIKVETKYNIGDKLYKIQNGEIRKYKIVSLQAAKHISEKGENVEITYNLHILGKDGVIYEPYSHQEEETLDKDYFKTQEGLINYLLKTAQK